MNMHEIEEKGVEDAIRQFKALRKEGKPPEVSFEAAMSRCVTHLGDRLKPFGKYRNGILGRIRNRLKAHASQHAPLR
jgi:hypothetical protein